MNKLTAIKILRKQIVKIEQKNFNHPTWSIQTRTYLKRFFGQGSEEHDFFYTNFWNVDSVITKGLTIEVKKA